MHSLIPGILQLVYHNEKKSDLRAVFLDLGLMERLQIRIWFHFLPSSLTHSLLCVISATCFGLFYRPSSGNAVHKTQVCVQRSVICELAVMHRLKVLLCSMERMVIFRVVQRYKGLNLTSKGYEFVVSTEKHLIGKCYLRFTVALSVIEAASIVKRKR